MPYVSTFMYAEGSMPEITSQGQRLHIISPMHVFQPMFIPGTFSFCVVFGILEIDINKENTVRFTFSSPNEKDEPLIDTGNFSLPAVSDKNVIELPEDMRGVIMNIGFQNVVLRYEGSYKSELFFNGESLGVFPIKVKGREKL